MAVVDLGKQRKIRSLAAGFLQNTCSWILLPAKVVFEVSSDGENFETVAELTHSIPPDLEGSVTRDFLATGVDRRARYIRMTARNAGPLPEGHPGAGHPSWLFADEIMVEY